MTGNLAYISGPSGIGKTTIAMEMKDMNLPLHIEDDKEFGSHPEGDETKWMIDIVRLERVNPDIFFSISTNWLKVAELPWKAKIFLYTSDTKEHEARLLRRVKEGKNSWGERTFQRRMAYEGNTPRMLRMAEQAGFTLLDTAKLSVSDVIKKIILIMKTPQEEIGFDKTIEKAIEDTVSYFLKKAQFTSQPASIWIDDKVQVKGTILKEWHPQYKKNFFVAEEIHSAVPRPGLNRHFKNIDLLLKEIDKVHPGFYEMHKNSIIFRDGMTYIPQLRTRKFTKNLSSITGQRSKVAKIVRKEYDFSEYIKSYCDMVDSGFRQLKSLTADEFIVMLGASKVREKKSSPPYKNALGTSGNWHDDARQIIDTKDTHFATAILEWVKKVIPVWEEYRDLWIKSNAENKRYVMKISNGKIYGFRFGGRDGPDVVDWQYTAEHATVTVKADDTRIIGSDSTSILAINYAEQVKQWAMKWSENTYAGDVQGWIRYKESGAGLDVARCDSLVGEILCMPHVIDDDYKQALLYLYVLSGIIGTQALDTTVVFIILTKVLKIPKSSIKGIMGDDIGLKSLHDLYDILLKTYVLLTRENLQGPVIDIIELLFKPKQTFINFDWKTLQDESDFKRLAKHISEMKLWVVFNLGHYSVIKEGKAMAIYIGLKLITTKQSPEGSVKKDVTDEYFYEEIRSADENIDQFIDQGLYWIFFSTIDEFKLRFAQLSNEQLHKIAKATDIGSLQALVD